MCYFYYITKRQYDMFWKKKEESKPAKTSHNAYYDGSISDSSVYRNHREAQNELLLNHVVSAMERMSSKAKSVLSTSQEELEEILDMDDINEIKSELQHWAKEGQHRILQFEYIDANKTQPWDQAKFDKFSDRCRTSIFGKNG